MMIDFHDQNSLLDLIVIRIIYMHSEALWAALVLKTSCTLASSEESKTAMDWLDYIARL
jgi:hypothetical protein